MDNEQHERVRDCFLKEQVTRPQDRFDLLIHLIEGAIGDFRQTYGETATFRETHDTLREYCIRSYHEPPPVHVLREELYKLPRQAIEHLAQRAEVVLPKLLPDAFKERGSPGFSDGAVSRLLEWAPRAEDAELVGALRTLTLEGAQVVPGRSRGQGKRGPYRAEPTIMGVTRGADNRRHYGHPAHTAQQKLIERLAIAWLGATDEAPGAGRSDHTGFGDLVHSVFQWLEISDEAAAYALRRYWETIKEWNQKYGALVAPPACTECRWVRQPADDAQYYCEKMSVPCAKGREKGANCGPDGLMHEAK